MSRTFLHPLSIKVLPNEQNSHLLRVDYCGKGIWVQKSTTIVSCKNKHVKQVLNSEHCSWVLRKPVLARLG